MASRTVLPMPQHADAAAQSGGSSNGAAFTERVVCSFGLNLTELLQVCISRTSATAYVTLRVVVPGSRPGAPPAVRSRVTLAARQLPDLMAALNRSSAELARGAGETRPPDG